MPVSIELFTSQQIRELKLIALLKEHETLRDYKSICQQLNCSFLTLQTEIATLQAFPEVKDLQYIYSHLKVQFQEEFGAKKLYQSVLLESNSLRLLEELFFKTFTCLEELSEELFISLSTLKRLLKKTNTYLKQNYNFIISVKDLTLTGDETAIRLFFLRYFSEAYDQQDWPFGGKLDEDLVEQLLALSPLYTLAKKDFSLHHHLKILVAIHWLRLKKGYCSGNVYDRAKLWLDQIDSALFEASFQLKLSAETLSEIFGDYLQDGLILSENDLEEDSHQQLTRLNKALSQLEQTVSLAITNRREMAIKLHNTLLLGPLEQHHNFLVYDYRKDYLDYFKSDYPRFYQEIQRMLEKIIVSYGREFSKINYDHLTYVLLISWDNLFLQLSQQIQKHRLLIIERGTRNVGQFLQAYLGQFFEITIFEGHNLKDLEIETQFDLVLTDTILEEMDGVCVYYFSQLVPNLALSRLNQYLKENLQKSFC